MKWFSVLVVVILLAASSVHGTDIDASDEIRSRKPLKETFKSLRAKLSDKLPEFPHFNPPDDTTKTEPAESEPQSEIPQKIGPKTPPRTVAKVKDYDFIKHQASQTIGALWMKRYVTNARRRGKYVAFPYVLKNARSVLRDSATVTAITLTQVLLRYCGVPSHLIDPTHADTYQQSVASQSFLGNWVAETAINNFQGIKFTNVGNESSSTWTLADNGSCREQSRKERVEAIIKDLYSSVYQVSSKGHHVKMGSINIKAMDWAKWPAHIPDDKRELSRTKIDEFMDHFAALWAELDAPTKKLAYRDIKIAVESYVNERDQKLKHRKEVRESMKAGATLAAAGVGAAAAIATGGFGLPVALAAIGVSGAIAAGKGVDKHFDDADAVAASFLEGIEMTVENFPTPTPSFERGCKMRDWKPSDDQNTLPYNQEYQVRDGVNQFECCDLCQEDEDVCQGFYFVTASHTCHLLTTRAIADADNLEPLTQTFSHHGVIGFRRISACKNNDETWTDLVGRRCVYQTPATCYMSDEAQEQCCACGGGHPAATSSLIHIAEAFQLQHPAGYDIEDFSLDKSTPYTLDWNIEIEDSTYDEAKKINKAIVTATCLHDSKTVIKEKVVARWVDNGNAEYCRHLTDKANEQWKQCTIGPLLTDKTSTTTVIDALKACHAKTATPEVTNFADFEGKQPALLEVVSASSKPPSAQFPSKSNFLEQSEEARSSSEFDSAADDTEFLPLPIYADPLLDFLDRLLDIQRCVWDPPPQAFALYKHVMYQMYAMLEAQKHSETKLVLDQLANVVKTANGLKTNVAVDWDYRGNANLLTNQASKVTDGTGMTKTG